MTGRLTARLPDMPHVINADTENLVCVGDDRKIADVFLGTIRLECLQGSKPIERSCRQDRPQIREFSRQPGARVNDSAIGRNAEARPTISFKTQYTH